MSKPKTTAKKKNKSVASRLTDKQKCFVDQYLIDLNATQAAIRAGYSKKTAEAQASRLLTKVNIQESIRTRQLKLQEKAELTQEMVVNELKKIGFSDMKKYVTWGPGGVTLKDSSELEDEDAACISEVSESKAITGGSIKFKLHDKVKSLELLGKHLGMFADRIDLQGELNVNFIDNVPKK